MSVESNLASFWYCFTELCDWFILKTCATYSTIQPITCKTTKTNCALAARVFPRLPMSMSNCSEFPLVHCVLCISGCNWPCYSL